MSYRRILLTAAGVALLATAGCGKPVHRATLPPVNESARLAVTAQVVAAKPTPAPLPGR